MKENISKVIKTNAYKYETDSKKGITKIYKNGKLISVKLF